jgi:hypothetical protein
MSFVVAGVLSAPTGLGEAALQILRGCMVAGHQVTALDLSQSLAENSIASALDLPAKDWNRDSSAGCSGTRQRARFNSYWAGDDGAQYVDCLLRL